MIYIGLDTAIMTGIALWYPQLHQARVIQVKGDPLQTFGFVARKIMPLVRGADVTICMELTHHFQNAKTIRSSCERYGFIKYSLKANYPQIPVFEIGVKEARHNLGTKEKLDTLELLSTRYQGDHFTDNHSDALAICFYQSVKDGDPFSLKDMKITNLTEEDLA